MCVFKKSNKEKKILETLEVEEDKRIGCGKCVQYCPHNAVRMKKREKQIF